MQKYPFNIVKLAALVAVIFGISCAGNEASAGILADGLKTFEVMPFRLITVKGNAAKFRALNWMNDGVTGGVKEMSFDGDAGKGKHLSFEGHVIPGDNDFGVGFELTKTKSGYIKADYGNFRRYYDVYGGFYSNFSAAKAINRFAADPKIDVGHFNLEIGSPADDDRGVSFSYNRFTRDGIKSMLDWGTVTEAAISRKIFPSWEEVGQATDTIALKARTEIAGYKINGEQRAQFFTGRVFREDNTSLATTPAMASQEQEPLTKQLISSLKADRWIIDDKTYTSFAYQFQHLRSDQNETIRNYNTSGVTTSNSRNVYVDAENSRDSHSWVQHLVTDLMPDLNLVVKGKEEIVSQTADSFAQGYTGGTNITTNTENYITRTGEAVSLRYSGIPKTSLYTDWDFQQSRNWLSKWRRSGTSTPTFYENLDRNPEMTGVIGARYTPNSKFSMTSQLRRQTKNHTFDTFYSNDPGIAIFKLRTKSDEFDNRLTWKINKWIQNSFRVQLLDTVYRVQTTPEFMAVEDNDWIKSNGTSRVYTYDIVLQPWDEWLFDLGGSLNNFKVSTPASQVAPLSGGIPVYLADVYTVLLSASYAPKENFSVYSSAQYSVADNIKSHGYAGIPFGTNNENYNVNLGMKWSPKKDLSLEPSYGYYSYKTNPDGTNSMDYGNYSAHVYTLDVKYTW